MKIKTLKDLTVPHPYYMSPKNYYSNEASESFDTWPMFYKEYCDLDIDLNLVIRWDITKSEGSENYSMQIVIVAQRKGIYIPIQIARIFEDDVPSIVAYLKPHFSYIKKMWEPIS